ncbi:MAG: signal peptidase I [Methanobrevibacter sp.]|uniref:signal peptidase I n=1 Tax=Methanobrevibacter sp. TaxID=66852 RepID=UPI0026DFC672|nr:signal peptidase I [Methanobrevibacter sp.]MDO5847918.1 signal peptidase I [Methanobrevibacter sp.]
MVEIKEIVTYIVIIAIALLIAQHLNVVVSGSMEPVFYRGDIVAVEKSNLLGLGIHEFNPEDVKVGDIVVYDAKWVNESVIHRVINITEINGSTYYVIKGDHNNAPDPYYVKASQITDRVITIGDNPLSIPYIGNINLWLKGL